VQKSDLNGGQAPSAFDEFKSLLPVCGNIHIDSLILLASDPIAFRMWLSALSQYADQPLLVGRRSLNRTFHSREGVYLGRYFERKRRNKTPMLR
jgi:hypothetical protein